MANTLKKRGIKLVTGGTDSHIVLLDLREHEETGAELEKRFENHRVLLNKNQVPRDQRGPSITSGLRIGTTNLAILGLQQSDLNWLGNWICDIVEGKPNQSDIVSEILRKYPPPAYFE